MSRRKVVRLLILAVFVGIWFVMRSLDNAAPVPTDVGVVRPGAGDAAGGGPGDSERATDVDLATEGNRGSEPEERVIPATPTFVPLRLSGVVNGGVDVEPVAEARVRAYTIGDAGALVEVTTSTDGEGLYALDLALAEHWARDGIVWVGLQVEGGGGRALHELAADVRENPVDVRFDVWLEPGGGFEGRVLDADGEPAGRADVYLFGSFDGDGQNGWIEVDAARALPDGRFLVRAAREGSYSLRARAEGRGATLRDLGSFDGHGFQTLPDVYLSGGGVLMGRVSDPAGNGIADVSVRAIHTELGSDWAAVQTSATRLSEGNLGQLYAEVKTGPRGGFRIGGLAPGEFWIQCEAAGELATEGLDPGPYPVGKRDVALTMAEYRLTVTLAERPGGSQPRGRAYCAELVPAFGARPEEELWEPLGDVQTRPVYESEQAIFRVLPGHRYAVGVASSSLPPLEEIAVIAEDDFRPRLELRPERAQPFGRVRVWVDTPQGDLLRTAVISVLSPVTGVVLQEFTAPVGTEGYTLDLAPGRYRVQAGPRDWPQVGLPLLPGRAVVEVTSNATLDLELHARAGAELTVELRVDGEIADAELAAAYAVVLETGDRPSPGVRKRHGATVQLEPAEGGRAEQVEFVFGDGLQPFPPTALLPGERAMIAEVLEPGAYVLTVAVPGFEPTTRLVDVDVAEKNVVTVALVPH